MDVQFAREVPPMVRIHSHIARGHGKNAGAGVQRRVMLFLDLVIFFGTVLKHRGVPPTSMRQTFVMLRAYLPKQFIYSVNNLFTA